MSQSSLNYGERLAWRTAFVVSLCFCVVAITNSIVSFVKIRMDIREREFLHQHRQFEDCAKLQRMLERNSPPSEITYKTNF